LVLALALGLASADFYLHGPRGSNNRLNEQAANRDDNNRLFDSQNNGRGGYNVGDRSNTAATTGTGAELNLGSTINFNDPVTAGQYQMVFYEQSILTIEWTAQHGCGGNPNDSPAPLNCALIFQFTCDTKPSAANGNADRGMTITLHDGGSTTALTNPGSYRDVPSNNAGLGHHESEAYYFECETRERNRGLFLADNNLGGNEARFTRQNPNGDRSGLECPEERDYYPYWHPAPWVDIYYLTNEDLNTRCPFVQTYSQNVNTQIGKCVNPGSPVTDPTISQIQANNPADCAAAGGQYKYMSWSMANAGFVAPTCAQAPWSRVNHLGNGETGFARTLNWTLPSWSLLDSAFLSYPNPATGNFKKCVFRGRYNLTTGDYPGWTTDASMNDDQQKGVVSPVQQNPTVDIGVDIQGLRLAMNTNQFGRTFQDRSHVFYIRSAAGTPWATGYTIYNLGVRGKRGNIVQTYPSVEYDYQPNRMHLLNGGLATDLNNILVHVQWTGSNTHNNGDPGGDGQTGDAGQGTTGTDRHNFVQYRGTLENFPIALDKDAGNMWYTTTCYNGDGTAMNKVSSGAYTGMSLDCAVVMATSGQYRIAQGNGANSVTANSPKWDPLLNNAPASLIYGVLLKFDPSMAGQTIYYMSTRNNSFSNRTQKGVLIFT